MSTENENLNTAEIELAEAPVEEIVEEMPVGKRGLSASAKNNLRTLGTIGIALAVLVGLIAFCEVYQELCVTSWAMGK